MVSCGFYGVATTLCNHWTSNVFCWLNFVYQFLEKSLSHNMFFLPFDFFSGFLFSGLFFEGVVEGKANFFLATIFNPIIRKLQNSESFSLLKFLFSQKTFFCGKLVDLRRERKISKFLSFRND